MSSISALHHKIFLRLAFFLVAFGLVCMQTPAQSVSVGGGTLSWAATASSAECLQSGSVYKPTIYTYWTYNSFNYVLNGTSYPLSGTQIFNGTKVGSGPGYSGECLALGASPSPLALTFLGPAGNCTIDFEAAGEGEGSATESCTPGEQGLIYPKYVVVGVTYAPPGVGSDVQYTGVTSVGTTSGYGSAFSNDAGFTVSLSYTLGGGIPSMSTGPDGSVQVKASSSTDYIQTSQSSSAITLTKSASISYRTPGYPTTYSPNGTLAPSLPDDFDIIWVWLNAASEFTIFPADPPLTTTQVTQWNGYGYDPIDLPGPDIFPVQVGCLNGDFLTGSFAAAYPSYCAAQQGVLNRAWEVGKQSPESGAYTTAPGCSPQTAESPSICPNTQDAYNILEADPLAYIPGGAAYTLLDSSPPPEMTQDGRFTWLASANNPVPYVVGTQPSVVLTQMNTQEESSGGSNEFKQSISFSQTVSTGFAGLWKDSVTYSYIDTISSTYSWLTSLSTTQTVTDAFTIVGSSPPSYVPGEFICYQDNRFGTFMFYPSN